MIIKGLIVSALLLCLLSSSLGFAQNKVVVIPLMEEVRWKCEGTLSSGGRWCNQGNGTVLDMTTGLVWLKNAGWGGSKPWRNSSSDCGGASPPCYDDAHTRAGWLKHGSADAELSDGSQLGEWRLPTRLELLALASGPEALVVGGDHPFEQFFSFSEYWTSTTTAVNYQAYAVNVVNGTEEDIPKPNHAMVWPVRPTH